MAETNDTRNSKTDDRYKAVIALYAIRRLSCHAITEACVVSYSRLNAYLSRKHRDLVLARNDIQVDNADDANTIRLRKRREQTRIAHNRYSRAIEACRREQYLLYYISPITNIFHLDETVLANQLRARTGIIEWYEEQRQKRGLNDYIHRGI